VLKALLKGMGDFEVVSAVDGQEALKILESPSEGPFDLVLTDMWMPNLDGGGLAREIRANPALASLRVIVVTADVEFREKAAEMGLDGILLKPITGEKLSRILVG
jgi:two-component system chemotaxis response regulator CheY